jgi:hypothetical protein
MSAAIAQALAARASKPHVPKPHPKATRISVNQRQVHHQKVNEPGRAVRADLGTRAFWLAYVGPVAALFANIGATPPGARAPLFRHFPDRRIWTVWQVAGAKGCSPPVVTLCAGWFAMPTEEHLRRLIRDKETREQEGLLIIPAVWPKPGADSQQWAKR